MLLLPRFLCSCLVRFGRNFLVGELVYSVSINELFLCVLDAPRTMCICNMLFYLIWISISVASLFLFDSFASTPLARS
jgi:hypothetical protein